jgi:hypothetical protein
MKKSELQSLINECIGEVLNEGKVTKKKEAIKEIKRIIAENELSEEDIEEGFFGKLIGTEWDKAKAEKEYATRYVKQVDTIAKKFGTDATTMKDALIKIMMKIGGIPVFAGANAVKWDAEKKEFAKPGTKLGGPGGNVGG